MQLNEVRKEYQNLNGIVARIDQEANVIEQNAAQVSHYSDTHMDVNW